MKSLLLLLSLCCVWKLHAQDVSRTLNFPKLVERPAVIPSQKNIWVYVMAGQSNMAGRGLVESKDTLSDSRILTIDRNGQLILAKEPLNLHEPSMVGLDCGMSFARTLLKHIPKDISILVLHTAVGGSSIQKWIHDSIHREVPLLTNFKNRIQQARQYGEIKGILWHQGESDANEKGIPLYIHNLKSLFTQFRFICENPNLPIVMGELGYFSKTSHESFMAINALMHEYKQIDSRAAVVSSKRLDHKGDFLHFNSEGQRELGARYARLFLKKFKP